MLLGQAAHLGILTQGLQHAVQVRLDARQQIFVLHAAPVLQALELGSVLGEHLGRGDEVGHLLLLVFVQAQAGQHLAL